MACSPEMLSPFLDVGSLIKGSIRVSFLSLERDVLGSFSRVDAVPRAKSRVLARLGEAVDSDVERAVSAFRFLLLLGRVYISYPCEIHNAYEVSDQYLAQGQPIRRGSY